jgi:hypothetical protein
MAEKKLLRGIVLAAALCLAFAACDDGGTSGGDTGDGQIPASITGTWQVTVSGITARYVFSGTNEWKFSVKSSGKTDFTDEHKGTYTKNGATITFTKTSSFVNDTWGAATGTDPKPATLTGSTTFTQEESNYGTLTYTTQ